MKNDAPSAPYRDADSGKAGLIIIDMINPFDFDGGRQLHDDALRIVDPILALRKAAERRGLPVIYVNDNFGEWHSEKSRLVERAVAQGSEVARRMAPDDDDYFIIKPQFSGFYATNLQVLLPKLGVSRLILTGMATDICVLFTAADAHMRDYALWVPEDCVVSGNQAGNAEALRILRDNIGAETAPTSRLDIATWRTALDAGQPQVD
jgi:nicotinamidase-related amidase